MAVSSHEDIRTYTYGIIIGKKVNYINLRKFKS